MQSETETYSDIEEAIDIKTLKGIHSISPDDYTILTAHERLAVAILLSIVGLCSAMTMPIYWTALTQLEQVFNTTEEKINFTVTSYLCFQAVAPVFVSSLSDLYGRRPVILGCIIGGIATNIGLAVSRTYWLIVFLRCILATCLSPLISITSASVGDFTTKRNRGGLNGLTSGLTLVGQGIAPFLGAVMDTRWDWPAIFWFSAALEGVVLLVVFIALPETHRGFVGSLQVIPKSIIHKSPALLYFGDRCVPYDEALVMQTKNKYEPWKPLRLIFQTSALFILLPSSILFSIWNMIQTSMSVHLSKYYHYSVLHIGLCFFGPGIATVTGTLVSGKILDIIYKKKKQQYEDKYYGENTEKYEHIPPFNIIKVRLLTLPFCACVICASALAFGWCLQHVVSVAAIIVLSFLLTFFCMFPLNTTVTILIDMHPQIAGGAAALNNLFRCGMSAIFVSCLDKMESAMTTGGTYTFMAGIGMLFTSLIVLLIKRSERILEKAAIK